MQITSATQVLRPLDYGLQNKAGQNLPHRQDVAVSNTAQAYDFNNISPCEISELVRSGEIELSHFILALPESGIDLAKDVSLQMDEAFRKRIDFIGLLKEQISYRSSENMPVELHRNLFTSIESMHGMPQN